MNLVISVFAGCALGAGLALWLPLDRSGPKRAGPYLAAMALFSALVFAPISSLLYLLFPDWSLMYLASPAQLATGWVLLAIELGLTASPVLGLGLGLALIASGQRRAALGLLGAAGSAALFTALLAGRRLLRVTFYEHFAFGGPFESFFVSPLFPASLCFMLVLGAGFGAFALRLRRYAREENDGLSPNGVGLE